MHIVAIMGNKNKQACCITKGNHIIVRDINDYDIGRVNTTISTDFIRKGRI